jgi:hypothetical protein
VIKRGSRVRGGSTVAGGGAGVLRRSSVAGGGAGGGAGVLRADPEEEQEEGGGVPFCFFFCIGNFTILISIRRSSLKEHLLFSCVAPFLVPFVLYFY